MAESRACDVPNSNWRAPSGSSNSQLASPRLCDSPPAQHFYFLSLSSLLLLSTPASPSHHVGEDQRGDDRGVALNHEFRCRRLELAPGDFLVWHRAAVSAEARHRITDLAEVAPQRNVELQVLDQHRDDADGKVSGDSARRSGRNRSATVGRFLLVPASQPFHLRGAGGDRAMSWHRSVDHAGGIDVAQR